MMRYVGLLPLLCACLSLAASEAERRSLEAWQAALTAADRDRRIEFLTDSMAERYSHSAEFLLGRTVWDDPAAAGLTAEKLLTKLEEKDTPPELKLAEWLALGLRQRFPAWKIGLDRWRRMEEAALAPCRRREGDAPLSPADRRSAAALTRQLADDELMSYRFDDALKHYGEVERLDPDPPAEDLAYRRALTAFSAAVWAPGDAARQERLRAELEHLAAREPAEDAPPEAWSQFGDWYLQLGDDARADRIMRKLAELHPEWPGTIIFRLRLLGMRGDYAALAETAAALKKDAVDLPVAYLFRHRAARCAGDWTEAAKMAEALRASPNDPSFQLTEALLYRRRWREAAAEIAKFPPSARNRLMLLSALFRKDFKALLDTFREAEPKLRGEALKDLRLAIVAIAELTGDRDLLQEYWDKLEKNGDLAEPEAANAVGYTAATMSHRLPEARSLIESALAAEPFSAAIMDSMAWVLFKQGDLAGARSWIDRSLACSDRDEDDIELEIHAGDICAAQGDREAAEKHYRRALALRPRLPKLDEAAVRAKLKALSQPRP